MNNSEKLSLFRDASRSNSTGFIDLSAPSQNNQNQQSINNQLGSGSELESGLSEPPPGFVTVTQVGGRGPILGNGCSYALCRYDTFSDKTGALLSSVVVNTLADWS